MATRGRSGCAGLTAHLRGLTKEQRLEFFVRYLRLHRRVELHGFRRSRAVEQPKPTVPPDRNGRGKGVGSITNGNNIGADYTPDQLEFMLAMHREQVRLGRKIGDAEVLRVAKALGYRREGT